MLAIICDHEISNLCNDSSSNSFSKYWQGGSGTFLSLRFDFLNSGSQLKGYDYKLFHSVLQPSLHPFISLQTRFFIKRILIAKISSLPRNLSIYAAEAQGPLQIGGVQNPGLPDTYVTQSFTNSPARQSYVILFLLHSQKTTTRRVPVSRCWSLCDSAAWNIIRCRCAAPESSWTSHTRRRSPS